MLIGQDIERNYLSGWKNGKLTLVISGEFHRFSSGADVSALNIYLKKPLRIEWQEIKKFNDKYERSTVKSLIKAQNESSKIDF